MSETDESLTLDPFEFIPERTELGLDLMGIHVREANWGDSEHELFLVRQALGEIPADRHPPNRIATFKLRVGEDSTVNLAEAAMRFQQKIGLMQRRGGWVRRDLDTKSGFVGSVAGVVKGVAISGLDGWMMAHRKMAHEVMLSLTIGPYLYGVKELEGEVFKGSEVRKIEWLIENVRGSAPGLVRVRVKNEGTKDWMGALSVIESEDMSEAATAKLSYEAESLTLLGNAVKGVRTGASGAGNNVVKTGSLAGTWQAVLGSRDPVTGEQMTHTGSRRPWLRLWDPNGSAGNLRFRIEWRVLGSTRWIPNKEKASFLVGNFSYVDLGQVRLEQAVLGGQRWEFRIAVRTIGTIGEEGELDVLFIAPTEQYALAQQDIEEAAGGNVIWEDSFEEEAGNVTGKSAPLGGVYEGAGDAADFQGDPPNGRIKRSENADATINSGRFLVAGSSKRAYTTVSGTVSNLTKIPYNMRSGYLFRYIDTSNWARVCVKRNHYTVVGGGGPVTIESGSMVVEKCVAGVVKILYDSGQWASLVDGGKLTVQVTTAGVITANANEGEIKITFTDTDFAVGNTLGEGKVGVYDAMTGVAAGSTETRRYSAALATTVATGLEQDTICFAGRMLEFRSDGVYRQHPTDDVWSKIVPDGFLHYAPPSGLEGKPARGMVLASTGNFKTIPDEGNLKMSAQAFYFPGWHYTSEAA